MTELLLLDFINYGRIIVLVVLLAYCGVKLFSQRRKTLVFLFTAVLSLVITDILNSTIGTTISTSSGAPDMVRNLLPSTTSVFSLVAALFFLYFFLETFDKDVLLTGLNIIFTIWFTFISSGLMIALFLFSNQFGGTLDKPPSGSTGTSSPPTNNPPSTAGIFDIPTILFGLLVILSLILAICLFINIVRQFVKQYKRCSNNQSKMIFKEVVAAMIIIICGIGLAFSPLNQYTSTITVIGYTILIVVYSRRRQFFLGEAHKKLLIMNNSGLPVYSYAFHQFSADKQQMNDDVLFSGALLAIKSLIQEFTGKTDQMVEEIALKNTVLLIKNIKVQNELYSILLLSDKSTNYLRHSLNKFVTQIGDQIVQKETFVALSPQIKENLDNLVEQTFGNA